MFLSKMMHFHHLFIGHLLEKKMLRHSLNVVVYEYVIFLTIGKLKTVIDEITMKVKAKRQSIWTVRC